MTPPALLAHGDSSTDASGVRLLLSLISAGLAQGKGRSGLDWWLLSILLGPIATLIIVVLDAKKEKRARRPAGASLSRPVARSLRVP